MKTRKKIALEYLILEVLETELSGKDTFLSYSELARRVNALSYQREEEREFIYPSSVKERMPIVRKIGDTKGMTIIAHRIKHGTNGSKSLKILGWKIAGPNDADYIRDELEIRKTLSNGNAESFHKIVNTASRKGLIEPKNLPELNR